MSCVPTYPDCWVHNSNSYTLSILYSFFNSTRLTRQQWRRNVVDSKFKPKSNIEQNIASTLHGITTTEIGVSQNMNETIKCLTRQELAVPSLHIVQSERVRVGRHHQMLRRVRFLRRRHDGQAEDLKKESSFTSPIYEKSIWSKSRNQNMYNNMLVVDVQYSLLTKSNDMTMTIKI